MAYPQNHGNQRAGKRVSVVRSEGATPGSLGMGLNPKLGKNDVAAAVIKGAVRS